MLFEFIACYYIHKFLINQQRGDAMQKYTKNHVKGNVILTASLFVILTLILGPIHALADPASIYYNFSFTSNAPTGASITGQFEVISGGNGGTFPYTIIGITGNVSGFQIPDSDGSIYGLIPANQFGYNDNYFSPNSPFVTFGSGVSFRTNSQSGASFNLFFNDPSWAVQNTYNGSGQVYYGIMTSSLSQ